MEANLEYKLFNVDEMDHVVRARDLLAHDDLAALQEAEAACEKSVVEVWQGARRVVRVNLGNAPLRSSDRRSL